MDDHRRRRAERRGSARDLTAGTLAATPRRAIAGAALLGLALLSALAARPATAAPIDGAPPYPPSERILAFRLDWGSLRRLAPGSDLWLTSWARNGNVYSAWGDGGGLDGTNTEGRVSLGVARLFGNSAATVRGRNLIGGMGYRWAGCFPRGAATDLLDRGRQCAGRDGLHGKAFGLLALGETLHAFVSPGSAATNYREARLYSSQIGTNSWRRASWAFSKDGAARLLSVAFLQAGQDGRGTPGYVYAYAPRYAPVDSSRLSIQKGPAGGEIALLRAPRAADLQQRASWSFYAGQDGQGQARWSGAAADLKPAITVPEGVGWVMSASYVPALKRYLVMTEYGASHAGRFLLLEGPTPRGPWRTVAKTVLDDPQGRVDTTFFLYTFLANSFSADGRRFTLVLTGSGRSDAMVLIDGRLELAPTGTAGADTAGTAAAFAAP